MQTQIINTIKQPKMGLVKLLVVMQIITLQTIMSNTNYVVMISKLVHLT